MSYTQARDPLSGAPTDAYIVRDADGAHVPNDGGNLDWQAYQAWLSNGNAPVLSAPAMVGAARIDAEYQRRVASAGL